jgi:hypothetical protein
MAGKTRDEFFAGAVRQSGLSALDWVLRFAQDVNPESPEYGGIRNVYDPMRREFRRAGHGLCLTWSACLAGFAALTAYDVTGDEFYRDRVDLIARYVKSNQNLDESDDLRYGSFVVSRDRRFVDVPDLSWAGRLFVHLHHRTGEQEYLDRARLAADWLLRVAAMSHGGFTTFYLLDTAEAVEYSHGSDGQHGLFLGDLYEATREEKYAAALAPLADMLSGPGQHDSGAYYVSIRADGTPVYESWDEEAGHPLVEGIEKIVTGPRQNYYAAMFLVEQYRRDRNAQYLESARRCCDWTLGHFAHHGYLSEWLTFEGGEWTPDRHPDMAAPGSMVRVYLALAEVDPGPRWLAACSEAAAWTMRWQRWKPDQPDLNGAVNTEPHLLVAYHISFAAWGLLALAQKLCRS